jgi:hypothetical protein
MLWRSGWTQVHRPKPPSRPGGPGVVGMIELSVLKFLDKEMMEMISNAESTQVGIRHTKLRRVWTL